MSESFDDQLSRIELMASGDPTWDLSPNDCGALNAVLDDRQGLKSVITELPHPDDVDLALRALNMGGTEFREDCCACDPSVGCSPCPYCAIDSVLRRVHRAAELKVANAAKDNNG